MPMFLTALDRGVYSGLKSHPASGFPSCLRCAAMSRQPFLNHPAIRRAMRKTPHPAPMWGMGSETAEIIPERVGNLTVDIFDGATKQLVFRGEASDSVSKNADKNDKRLEHSVEEMFKKFPGREKR